MDHPSSETAALVALLRAGNHRSSVYADLIEEGTSPLVALEDEQQLLAPELIENAKGEIARWTGAGIRPISVLDPEYPPNLRVVHDRPPLLFLAGRLVPGDARSVAVIGSRKASPSGVERARAMANELIDAGYTIVSGLALGVDTAAHVAALERGVRTLAVIGTGLEHSYPRENSDLQQRISRHGAVISRFWPETRPSRETFPLRNAVMSGVSLATVVVEANRTSGARIQARHALGHGRPVLLSASLLDQDWASELARRPGVHVIRSPGEAVELVERLSSTDALVP